MGIYKKYLKKYGCAKNQQLKAVESNDSLVYT